MMNEKEVISAMILARLSYYHLAAIHQLYREAGSAAAVLDNHNNIRDIIPDANNRLVEALRDCEAIRPRVEEELSYDLNHGIRPLIISDVDYPHRLAECDDAPLVLFFKGNTDLNKSRVINLVGTRKCTVYGQDLIQRFLTDLSRLCPDTLIVSGLAYGIDICAHRQALANGLDTVAVLAHGLDDLYPHTHRATATEMMGHGGLLTEFMTRTNADKINFVRRNRIVAGMSDACILVESAKKGGGLITAEISRGYDREVFAFPGRIGDTYSEGCNQLIADNGAVLLTNAEDFVKTMGWETDASLEKARKEGIERVMFPEFSDEEAAVVNVLSNNNDLHLNMLATQCGIPVNQLTGLLFELEMKGVVRTMAGGLYHLLK